MAPQIVIRIAARLLIAALVPSRANCLGFHRDRASDGSYLSDAVISCQLGGI